MTVRSTATPDPAEHCTVQVAGTTLSLLPERAAYWHTERTLFIADTHWGKTASFRTRGLAVPETIAADLSRLDVCLAQTGAQRLVLLGDCLHDRRGRDAALEATVAAWRARQAAVEVVLVGGNHDRHAGPPPAAWAFATVTQFAAPPFIGAHFPQPATNGYVLAGHLHPVVTIGGRWARPLRAPCFWFGAQVGVLPAFGSFTGGHVITPSAGERVFAIGPGQVVEVRC